MDIKQQAITEYLNHGIGYRQLAAKYGISRTTMAFEAKLPAGVK